jgi:hypothetical protein
MAGGTSKETRRLLLGLLLLLGTALAGSLSLWRWSPKPATASSPRDRHAAVEFDRFSARRERIGDGQRLSVSLRLRTNASEATKCFVFVVAHNDRTDPRRWSIWPPQPAGPSITAGGHFHGATPTTGYRVELNDDWQRITATVPEVAAADFDTVVVYVLDQNGRILLARPFRV